MGDFKKNPKEPFEVPVPNKIRKRIAMHEREGSFLKKLNLTGLKKIISLSPTPVVKKQGSLWSRFTNRIKGYFQ